MAAERETAAPPRIQMIARAQIAPDPDQPRTDADDELRGSIAHEGILEPIIVRAYPMETPAQQREAKKTPWMIVNGERRWRGSAGVLEELPCIVRRDARVLDAALRKITQLAANEHKAMSPLDEGRAYHEVMLATGMSIEELAEQLGKPQSTVGDRVRVMELGPWLEMIDAGKVAWSRAVESLVPLRTAAPEAHERAIARFRNDYRFHNHGVTLSSKDFATVIEAAYQSEMYPLTKGRYSDRPTFNTSSHGQECECGGVKFGSARQLHCANPAWWRPLHRQALSERKAKSPKQNTGERAKPEGPKLPKLPNGLKIEKGGPSVYASSFRGRDGRPVWEQDHHSAEWQIAGMDYNGRKSVPIPIFDVEEFCRDADLEKLTLYVGTYSGVVLVSKDTVSYARALETWKLRRAEQYEQLSGEFGVALRAGLDEEKFTITGPGVTMLVAQLGVIAASDDDDEYRHDADEKARSLSRGEQLLDVARALNLVTDDADDPNEPAPPTWCEFDSVLDAGVVLGGLAVALVDGLTFPTAALEAWEKTEIARMRKLPLTRLSATGAPDPAQASPRGNKWERRKKRGKAKHATPADASERIAKKGAWLTFTVRAADSSGALEVAPPVTTDRGDSSHLYVPSPIVNKIGGQLAGFGNIVGSQVRIMFRDEFGSVQRLELVPTDTDVPVRITDDGAQEIRAAVEADDVDELDEDLEEAAHA
jgi:ParB/RepB/Spo0J family partition protein